MEFNKIGVLQPLLIDDLKLGPEALPSYSTTEKHIDKGVCLNEVCILCT